MDKEKIVVILLLITIILSVGSLIFTFSLNMTDRMSNLQTNQGASSPANTGNVELVIKEPTGGAT